MKKVLYLVTPVVLGVIAAILRGYELAFGFDFVSGLPKGTCWITGLLLAVGAVIGAGMFFVTRKDTFPAQEKKKSTPFAAASFVATAFMLALGGYLVFENKVVGDTLIYVYAALCVAGAMSIAVLGAKNLEANDKDAYYIIAFAQVLWATLAVILVFRERVSEPIAEHFIFLLFAFLCILLFTYAQMGYVVGKNRLQVALIVGVMGVYFAAIEVIAPFIAPLFNAEYVASPDFRTILPLAAYLVYVPFALCKMWRNENNIETIKNPVD